jgi:hypothetical protein
MSPDQLAEILILTIKQAIAPVKADVSRLEAALSARDLALADVSAVLGIARERLASLEARAPVAGPAGQDGAPGAPGRDGTDGLGLEEFSAAYDDESRTLTLALERGAVRKTVPIVLAGLPRYVGVYVAGASYAAGDLATWAGSTWYCKTATVTKPGESPAWQLMVKAGRDLRPDRRSA